MPYAVLLRRPHVGRLLAWSLVGRLPTSMAALAIALTLRQVGVGFRLTGTVTGVFAVAAAIGGPLLGRIVDRLGQPRVLVASAAVAACGYAVLALAPGRAGFALLGAVVAGAATPPLEPCLRALWPDLVAAGDLESAYAVDAGAQELVFIAGPLAVAGIAAVGSPRSALWAAAVLGLIGALAVGTAEPSRSWTSASRSPDWLGALRSRPLILLLAALSGAGWTLGAFTVFTVAYAEQHRLPGGAGTLLALSSTGALLGAVAYGAYGGWRWRAAPGLKCVLFALGMAAAYWLVALVPGPPAMAAVALLTGVFFAPLLTVAFGMVGELAPAGTVTEAFAWLVTLIGAGIAGGSAAGGVLLSGGGPGAEAAMGACGVTLATAVLLGAVLLPDTGLRRTSADPDPQQSAAAAESDLAT